MTYSRRRRAAAEGVGTALLLSTVVGSGMMAERLAEGNVALALLANTIATGAGLFALISTFGAISGAHFNPAVTFVLAWRREFERRDVAAYVLAQVGGAFAGVALAHAMFDLALLAPSTHVREGFAQALSEGVATFGLILVILLVARHKAASVPHAVAAYITAAYWFTASTSFANPAVTFARALTPTFAGIRPNDVMGYVIAELIGAALATLFVGWIEETKSRTTNS